MKQYVMVTDTHLGRKNHNQFWAKVTEDLFDEIIDYCNTNNINTVIHLGDFFDSRKTLNVLTINKGIEICKKFEKNEIHLNIIKGNHDQFYKNLPKPHSLAYLDLFEYVHVIDDGVVVLDNTFALVPWGYPVEELDEDHIVMGHFEINGFITNYSGHVQEGSKLNKSDFNKFSKVYSGHFHTPSKDGNIEYIGSAFAMDFNDINSERGYYVIDSNGNKEFIEYTSAPKFKVMDAEDEIDREIIKGNIIRLTFTKDYGNVKNDKILQDVRNMNPVELHVDYKIAVDDDDIILDDSEFDIEDNYQVFMDYIDKSKEIPKHINRKMLKKVVDKIERGE